MNVYIKNIFLFLMSLCSGISASQSRVSLPAVSTLQEALFNVRKVILNFPVSDATAAQAYEKQQSSMLTACAKVLYDNAQNQILQTLQEIDNRIAYWRYQKDHQWNYFLTKNPIKWFKGEQQKVEIAHNLEQLQSHQGELYVLLGRLAELGTAYDRDYKTVFITDYTKAYAWIDDVLALLSRVKINFTSSATMSIFIIRAHVLKFKLTNIRNFKNDILSEMKETQIPSHWERNWLKYIVLLAVFGEGYKYANQISDFALTSLNNTKESLLNTAENVKEIFFPGRKGREGLMFQPANMDKARSAMIEFLDRVETDKIITPEEKAIIIADEASGSSAEFQKLINEKIMPSYWYLGKYGSTAWSIFGQLFVLHGGSHIEKEISGLRNIALLAPAVAATGIVGGLGYLGYRKVTARDYTSIRRGLIEINSLFVDSRKALDDEQYGKMLYLIYNLKQRAQKTIPVIDRGAFVEDLERIESQEFDVAAKRHIVDDMFRKYSFLR
ncbi:MAG TPA: hypothetical protein VKU36_00030 [Candidatus Babeliales bacterium]|nr:hypothetical protein [Candidatus Babeliales bacterium]